LRTYPPPLNYPHVIGYDLIGVDIELPFFDPGAREARDLLIVIIVVFGVGVVNVASATLRRCASLEGRLSDRLLVQLVEARDELFKASSHLHRWYTKY
jgi:hypothetical protein